MKKQTAVAIVIFCISMIILSAAWSLATDRSPITTVPSSSEINTLIYSTANEGSSQEIRDNSSLPIQVSSQSISGYMLKVYNGKIGVFKIGENSPIEELDVCIEDLPTADRFILQKGVYAEDKETLHRIMEDYES